jgi:hypothetical protein
MGFMRKSCCHILLIPLILLQLNGFSQQNAVENTTNEKKNIYLDASSGAAIPLGNYANDDPKDKTTGYAKTGFFIQANVDWVGKNYFGLALQLTYQNNALKDTAKTVISYGSSIPMGSGSWSNIYIMGGPVFLKQIKKIAIDAKLVGGFIISTSPVFETTNPETKLNEGGTGTGFALGVNVGLGYALSQKFALKLTFGYLSGFPKVDRQYNAYVIGIDNSGHFIYSSPMDIEIKKTVSTFNTGLGIIYKF